MVETSKVVQTKAVQTTTNKPRGRIRVLKEAGRKVSQSELSAAIRQVGLGKREVMILQMVCVHSLLSSSQIVRLVCRDLAKVGSDGTMQPGHQSRTALKVRDERLLRLVEGEFLRRAWLPGHLPYYWLGPLGIAWAKAQGIEIVTANLAAVEHTLMVADFMTWVIEETARLGGQAEWSSEAELGNWRAKARPDAEAVVEAAGVKLRFAVEIDRRTMWKGRLKKKVKQYETERERGQAVSQVLLVTTAPARYLPTILRALLEQQTQSKQQAVNWFVTATELTRPYQQGLNDRHAGVLTAPIWFRPSGGEPISLLPSGRGVVAQGEQ